MIFSLIFLTVLIFSFASAPIILNNAVYAVLYFIAVFLLVSGILLSCGIEFLAFVYAIVYIGAVAVLFLFVVMLLQVSNQYWPAIKTFWIILLLICISSVTFKILNILLKTANLPIHISNTDVLISNTKMAVNSEFFSNLNVLLPSSELYLISSKFYNLFGMLFLETAFILLLALIAVIILTKTVINMKTATF